MTICVLHKKRFIISLIFLALWGSLLFCLSSQSGAQTLEESSRAAKIISQLFFKSDYQAHYETVHFVLRKLAHVFLYFVVFFPVFGLASSFKYKKLFFPAAVSLAAISAVSFLDEWHKVFIAGRHFSVVDSLLNIAGAAAAMVCILIASYFFNKIHRKKHMTG